MVAESKSEKNHSTNLPHRLTFNITSSKFQAKLTQLRVLCGELVQLNHDNMIKMTET